METSDEKWLRIRKEAREKHKTVSLMIKAGPPLKEGETFNRQVARAIDRDDMSLNEALDIVEEWLNNGVV